MENFLTILTKITNKARPDAIYPLFFVVKILIHFLTLPQFFSRSILKKNSVVFWRSENEINIMPSEYS